MKWFVALFPILLIGFAASASFRCNEVLRNSDVLAGDLNASIENLARLKLTLEMAKIDGTDSLKVTALKHDYTEKEADLIQYIENQQGLTQEEFKDIFKRQIIKLQTEKAAVDSKDIEERKEWEKQNEVIEIFDDSIIDGNRAIFHTVKHGTYKMGVDQVAVVILTKDFDMMATPTTQVIWKAIADLAKTHFPGLYDSLVSDPSKFKGDTHPVEGISYKDIKLWIEALNNLSQLEKNNSGRVNITGLNLNRLISGHKKGDQYRLPTEAEWEFVARNRGQNNTTYFTGNNEALLDASVWSGKNSRGTTHPVATKKEFLVDGNRFFDLFGNVAEVMEDGYDKKLFGGTDPVKTSTDQGVVKRGGNFRSNSIGLELNRRTSIAVTARDEYVGFRLVRGAR